MDRKFGEVNRRIDKVETDVRELRIDMTAGFERMDEFLVRMDERMTSRLDGIQRQMIYMCISLTVAILGGFAGMAAFFGG